MFKTGIDQTVNVEGFNCNGPLVNEVIAHHFLRQGHFDLYETFAKESNVHLPEAYRDIFREMYEILAQLREKNILPAISWASRHRAQLIACDSQLEFKLHKLQFVHFLQEQQYEAALRYAKANFSPFALNHMRELQRLMGCFLYLNRLGTSPYSDLLSPTLWGDIEFAFARDCCQLLGLSHDSPLFVAVVIGAIALPILMRFFTVLQFSRGEWSQKDELPVEVSLAPEQRFHSVFVCPVSREQGREDNPPMIMPCGHVVCRESLMRLSKNGGKFKCPYCPSESTPAQARRVFF